MYVTFPVAIEPAGSWGHQAIELVQEIGRRIADITVDSRETTFLFQRLSVALQRGKRRRCLILRHFFVRVVRRCSRLLFQPASTREIITVWHTFVTASRLKRSRLSLSRSYLISRVTASIYYRPSHMVLHFTRSEIWFSFSCPSFLAHPVRSIRKHCWRLEMQNLRLLIRAISVIELWP